MEVFMPLSKIEIAKRAERIRAIYRAFLANLVPLRKEQDAIYRGYSEKLEQKKVEEIRKRLRAER
jgi:hypothetical protein